MHRKLEMRGGCASGWNETAHGIPSSRSRCVIVALPGEGPRIRFAGAMVPILLEILKEADETDDPVLIARAVNLQDDFLRLEVAGMDELLDNSSSS